MTDANDHELEIAATQEERSRLRSTAIWSVLGGSWPPAV